MKKTTRPARRVVEGNSRKGFASMDPEKQRQIASAGGKASYAAGKGRPWTSESARVAGRAGGLASRRGPAKKANGADPIGAPAVA